MEAAAVTAQKSPHPTHDVGQAKAEAIGVERGRRLHIRRAEHDMIDQRRPGGGIPTAALVPARHLAGGILTRHRRGLQILPPPDPKSDVQPGVVARVQGSGRVGDHLAIAG